MILIDTIPTEDSYTYLCIHSLRCDPTADTHDKACHRINDEERRAFYADRLDEAMHEHAELVVKARKAGRLTPTGSSLVVALRARR